MRRRYEDVSGLVQYQLKTNQQGNIEVYVDDRFVGNVSEGVCNWKDIEYKSKVTISLKGVEDKAKTSSKRVGPYCHINSIFGGNESYHAGPDSNIKKSPVTIFLMYCYKNGNITTITTYTKNLSGTLQIGKTQLTINYKQNKSQSFSGGSGDYVTSVSAFPFVTGPGNDSVEFEGEGRLIVETEASHYEIEVS